MSSSPNPVRQFASQDSEYPKQVALLHRAETVVQILGVAGAVLMHGLFRVTERLHVGLGLLLILAMIFLTLALTTRYRWSLAKKSFLRINRVPIALSAAWLLGNVFILMFVSLLPEWRGEKMTRFNAFMLWSEILIVIRAVAGTILVTRRATAGSTSPAVVLVSSFAILMTIGTLLLMLPRSRVQDVTAQSPEGAPFEVALFTATSTSCVTGLAVVHTGDYWSPMGQTIILCLFQIGGLGIMTCGAFFALASGRAMQISESATLRDMLESDQLGDVRRLVLTILIFTLGAELIGAVLISGLWADLPFAERVRFSLFHSVSAFCNAGFSLTENSFVGMGNRWQVWGGVAGLIVTGSMGFAVLYNVGLVLKSKFSTLKNRPMFNLPRQRIRLSLTSKIAGGTTIILLIAGAIGYGMLESMASVEDGSQVTLEESWFQSVTFRTAGFNTVDHGDMQPATKLFAILLMFVGASPGSTGGGVKTVCFAITMLSLLSVLRGRQRVEVLGRTIPEDLVNRALTIISLGILMVMCSTMLLVLFENQPALFLDHLFEATSAFATVGVSTGVTAGLQSPSKMVLVATMFIGRVGPLTLLIAMAGRTQGARYQYPFERVTLG